MPAMSRSQLINDTAQQSDDAFEENGRDPLEHKKIFFYLKETKNESVNHIEDKINFINKSHRTC